MANVGVQMSVSVEGLDQTITSIEIIPNEMLADEGLRQITRAAAQGYASYMKDNMLSGQRLRKRSGILHGSIVANSVSASTDAVVQAPGITYSRVHDLGLAKAGQVVRSHRRVAKGGKGFQFVASYTRNARQERTLYFSDTAVLGAQRAQDNIDFVVANWMRRVNGG